MGLLLLLSLVVVGSMTLLSVNPPSTSNPKVRAVGIASANRVRYASDKSSTEQRKSTSHQNVIKAIVPVPDAPKKVADGFVVPHSAGTGGFVVPDIERKPND